MIAPNNQSEFWAAILLKDPAECWPGLTAWLTNNYPEFAKMMILLEDKAPTFLDAYEGRALTVPSRSELRELARGVACYNTLKDLDSKQAAKAGKKLQAQYHCEAETIARYAKLGRRLAETRST